MVIIIILIKIYVICSNICYRHLYRRNMIVTVYKGYCMIYQRPDSVQSKIKRIHRAFHTFHQVNGSKPADSLFTIRLGKPYIDLVILIKKGIFFHSAGKNKSGRCINRQIKKHQLFKNLIIIDCILYVCQSWPQ